MAAPTIHLAKPTGVWRPVYAHRTALHATADQLVAAAWQADLEDVDLGPAIQAWQQQDSPTQSPAERLQAASAAILALLAGLPWVRTLTAIALAAQRAHEAGWQAGEVLASRDAADDTPYTDSTTPAFGQALSDQLAAHTAARVLATALAAAARRLARQLVTDGATTRTLKATLLAGYDILLATDSALTAAYGAGLLAAYQRAGAQALRWITAGDASVCTDCELAETNSPYSPFAAPTLPMHPRCRCILAPA